MSKVTLKELEDEFVLSSYLLLTDEESKYLLFFPWKHLQAPQPLCSQGR